MRKIKTVGFSIASTEQPRKNRPCPNVRHWCLGIWRNQYYFICSARRFNLSRSSCNNDGFHGRMATEYMALKAGAKVSDAIEMLRNFEGGLESMSTIYIIGEREKLLGQVPLRSEEHTS